MCEAIRTNTNCTYICYFNNDCLSPSSVLPSLPLHLPKSNRWSPPSFCFALFCRLFLQIIINNTLLYITGWLIFIDSARDTANTHSHTHTTSTCLHWIYHWNFAYSIFSQIYNTFMRYINKHNIYSIDTFLSPLLLHKPHHHRHITNCHSVLSFIVYHEHKYSYIFPVFYWAWHYNGSHFTGIECEFGSPSFYHSIFVAFAVNGVYVITATTSSFFHKEYIPLVSYMNWKWEK